MRVEGLIQYLAFLNIMQVLSMVLHCFFVERSKTKKDFYNSLKKNELHFVKLLENAENQNSRLKYIAQLEKGKASVGLQNINPDHDFYNLEGSDNIILFYTKRYNKHPLIIKGAGAGAEVTAAGIFGDIIRTGKR